MKKQIITLIAFIVCSCYSFGQNSAFVSGNFVNFNKNSIKCVLLVNDKIDETKKIEIPVYNGFFKQKLNIIEPTYLYITDGENYINGLIEPSDSIFLKFDTSNNENPLIFTGKGNQKFQFLNSFLQAKIYKKLVQEIPNAKITKFPFDYMFHYIDSAETFFVQHLNLIKDFMSDESYRLLLGDIKGSFLANRNRCVGFIYHENAEETLKNRQKELTSNSKTVLQNLMKFDKNFSYSKTYVQEVFNILFTNYDYLVVTNKTSNNLLSKYRYLDSLLPQELKIPVLTLFLQKDISTLNSGEEIEILIKNIYKLPQDSIYRNFITKKYKTAIDTADFSKGMPAPDFILENEKGEKVSLASFKGKVLYLDFWYAACGPCHALMETLKPAKEHFATNNDVVFLYISIDQKDVWKKSLLKYNIKGYHAYTQNLEGMHPIINAYKVSGYPTTCIIDKNGNIFNAHPSNVPDELQEQIIEALKMQ